MADLTPFTKCPGISWLCFPGLLHQQLRYHYPGSNWWTKLNLHLPSNPLCGTADLPAPLGVPPFHKKNVSHATQLRNLTELNQLWALCAPELLGPTSGKAQQVKTTPGHYNPNFRDNKLINILKNNVEEGKKHRLQYLLMLSYHHSIMLHRI